MRKLFLSSAIVLMASCAFAKDVAVIINSKSPFNAKMSPVVLKEIFLGKIKFEGKIKLLPSDQKDREIFETFLKKYIGVTPTAYKSAWVKKVFSEGGASPKIFERSEEVVKYVAGNDGAIGYVWDDDLSGKEEGILKASIGEK